MEKSKREKAIEQAQASLNIDRIYLSQDFFNSYRKKNGLQVQKSQTLTLKKERKNIK